MFNFKMYTDAYKNIVYIEPGPTFHYGPKVDWSDKLNLDQPIEIEEIGDDMNQIFHIGYKDGDYSVQRFNEENKTVLGDYEERLLSKFANTEKNKHENVLFAPSIIKYGSYENAKSAELLHVLDKDMKLSEDGDNDLVINFDTRIVRFEGVKDLPQGESLEFPFESTKYPLISFNDLCFEDRDGKTGLHKYYDENITLYNKSRRITCYLHLRVTDIEPFARLYKLKEDFRAIYIIKIQEEYNHCYLESIEFISERQASKCVFVKI